MSLACPITLDGELLRTEVSRLYSRVLEEPDSDYHFHRGAAYAAEFLGYQIEDLKLLPDEVTRVFAGVGNPLWMRPVESGETAVDIGCGGGADLLLAAIQAGPNGRVIGIDMTPGMLERVRQAADKVNLPQVELQLGDATSLPLDDHSVDVIVSNGVLNLVPEKDLALQEMRRVLKPGGRVQVADIALDYELSEDARADIDLWTG